MSGSNAGLVPVAIPSPVTLNPMPQPSAPQKSNANIIIVILLIAIIVFCIFLFTKLNTQNKQIKELQNERESNAKAFQLLQAIAQRVGVQQNEKGEIELLESGDCEEDGGDEKGVQCQMDGGVCASSDGMGDEKVIFIQSAGGPVPTPTPFFAKMFAQQRAFMSNPSSTAAAAQVVVEDSQETASTPAPTAVASEPPKAEEKPKEAVKESTGLDKVN